MSLIELLLDTLRDLSNREFEMFKKGFLAQNINKYDAGFRWRELRIESYPVFLLNTTERQDTVLFLVQCTYDPVEKTMEVLKRMERTDLVQRLSGRFLGPRSKTIKTKKILKF